MFESLGNLLLSGIGYSIRAMAAEIFRVLGWGGVAVLLGGVLLFLSMTINTMKELSRPRGMLVSAAVLAAGLAFAWWSWPTAQAATPGTGGGGTARLTQPEGRYAKKEPVARPVERVELRQELPRIAASPVQVAAEPVLEPMPWVAMAPLTMPLPTGIKMLRMPPVAVATTHTGQHPKAKGGGHTTVSLGERQPVAAGGRNRPSGGQASGLNGGFGLASRPQPTPGHRPRPVANPYRVSDAEYERWFLRMMGGPMMPGGMHPMGGHTGGVHHLNGHMSVHRR
jgi:hypothetical protein